MPARKATATSEPEEQPEIHIPPVAPEDDVLSQAAIVMEEVEREPDDQYTIVHSGIVLKLKPVPPLAIREAAVQMKGPSVPIAKLEDGREEPNPNDPDYLDALRSFAIDQNFMVANVLLGLGTKPGTIPEGYVGPESDEWIEPLEAFEIVVNIENRHKRYLAWLRYYALATEHDIAMAIHKVRALSGVTEVDVQRAARAFRSIEGRRADN